MSPVTFRSLPRPLNREQQIFLTALVAMMLFSACGGGATLPVEELPPCGPAEPALSKPPELPSGFPNPPGVTYTEAEKAGPSDIIQGYFIGDLPTGFKTYRGAFEQSPYDVLKDEQEARDAEVF
ncbi:MAG TPA: hypothetical protein VHH54_06635, partial [Actinomycetota bacterium]|nr:hypothetical protein [Actinomycetota bacterium]